ncbi:hypothetical protein K443DRAFT_628501 [Laccaria amethystina LaAM-08-1]|uniref:Uncharacterized protein n=1 Tax=Laccaria amethystina LaAM-08-1 TaxID=1095629 RepID=A0A0C9YA38_9AGAR|nr:hypothetical protein K443DRAFT_628501 [Laccaria amethystina LaAM-08-1]
MILTGRFPVSWKSHPSSAVFREHSYNNFKKRCSGAYVLTKNERHHVIESKMSRRSGMSIENI